MKPVAKMHEPLLARGYNRLDTSEPRKMRHCEERERRLNLGVSMSYKIWIASLRSQ